MTSTDSLAGLGRPTAGRESEDPGVAFAVEGGVRPFHACGLTTLTLYVVG
ncbi:hypothetical protein [Streptomyces niveiscabiei]|uniref:Uncharacterized protein n=1 Tax=Streptomyces niveiscabiei TaxID=164115 RepID=A0ABW9HLZ1_9ACTN